MSEEIKDEVTNEENIDQENTVEEANEESNDNSKAENAKIASILERKNKKIADLEEALAQKGNSKEGETETKQATKQTQGLTREEAILFARGLSEEEVNKAQKISQIEEISLTEAIDNPIFKAWKDNLEEQKKSEQASLGTSKGSPKAKEKPSFDSKGLDRDKHKALFNKKIGK